MESIFRKAIQVWIVAGINGKFGILEAFNVKLEKRTEMYALVDEIRWLIRPTHLDDVVRRRPPLSSCLLSISIHAVWLESVPILLRNCLTEERKKQHSMLVEQRLRLLYLVSEVEVPSFKVFNSFCNLSFSSL